MDNEPLSPEALSSMALAFSKTPYGEWLMDTLYTINDAYISDAKQLLDPNTKLRAVDRSAGISEVIDLIKGQIMQGENPEVFGISQSAIDKLETIADK